MDQSWEIIQKEALKKAWEVGENAVEAHGEAVVASLATFAVMLLAMCMMGRVGKMVFSSVWFVMKIMFFWALMLAGFALIKHF